MVQQIDDFTSTVSEGELLQFTSDYYILMDLRPEVPGPNDRIYDFPAGKVGLYTRFFEWANHRVPISIFLDNILRFYQLHISQLHVIGAGKISNFEINCRLCGINPTLHLFRAFYRAAWQNGWVTFSKRTKDPNLGDLQCYKKKVDKLPRWREKFFWVDDAVFPHDFAFHTQASIGRDERPHDTWYNQDHALTINTNQLYIRPYPEAFLVHMGLSRNYFEPEECVPAFVAPDGSGSYLS